jgi:hypothetical protein
MRRTKNHRQAAERLAEAMGFGIEKVSKTQVVVEKDGLRSGARKPVRALAFMAYTVMEIEGRSAQEVFEACRWFGNVPLKGLAAHEEGALAQVVEARP